MKISWKDEWPHLLLIALMLGLAISSWPSAPDRIPTHWNLKGEVDGWGGRFEGLFAMPLLAIVLYVGMLLLPRLDPGRANYATFASAYSTIRLMVLAVFAAIHGVVLLVVRGYEVRMESVMPAMIGVVFLVLGNLMGKLRPNWFVGIRTPWTLSSKRSWTRTHRAGGWMFLVIGLLTIAVAVLRPEWGVPVVIVGAVAGGLGMVIYSYVEWRKDPEKAPPAGTLPA